MLSKSWSVFAEIASFSLNKGHFVDTYTIFFDQYIKYYYDLGSKRYKEADT